MSTCYLELQMHLALAIARRVTLGAMAPTLCLLDLSSHTHSDSDPKLTPSIGQ